MKMSSQEIRVMLGGVVGSMVYICVCMFLIVYTFTAYCNKAIVSVQWRVKKPYSVDSKTLCIQFTHRHKNIPSKTLQAMV